jgi:hypothetical protein
VGFEGYLGNFEFINAFVCTASEMAGGFATVATLVFGGIALSIYIRTGSVAIPVVLLLLTGGAVIPLLAAPAIGIAGILLIVVGAGSMTLAYYRYSR